MSDFLDEKYRLQDYINSCNSDAREYYGGAHSCLKIDLEYETDLSPDYADFLDDFSETVDDLRDKLNAISSKVSNKFEEYKNRFSLYDKFYIVDLAKIKKLYESKKFKEAYEQAEYARSSIRGKKDEFSEKALRDSKLTMYEIRFCLAETEYSDDYYYIESLLNDFVNDLEIINPKRAGSVAPFLIDKYFDLAKQLKLSKEQYLQFYFINFSKARKVYDKFKTETTETIKKHIDIVTTMVDEQFIKVYEKERNISKVLILHDSVKKFPFVLRPKNNLILASQSELTRRFFSDNASKFTPDEFRYNIGASLREMFCLQDKKDFYSQIREARDSILAVVDPFKTDKRLLKIISDEFLEELKPSGYLHITGLFAIKYGLESLPFQIFNEWVQTNILKHKVTSPDLAYYVTRILGDGPFTKKQIKSFDETKAFAYKLNKKHFNNNKAVRNSKHIDLKTLVKCKRIAGLNYCDELVKNGTQSVCIPKCFEFKLGNNRLIQKIIFVIQQVCFAFFGLASFIAEFNLTFGKNLPTFKFLTNIEMPFLWLITGGSFGLIFLGFALITLRHEGRNSIAHLQNEKIIDITNLVLVSLGLVSMILTLVIPSQFIFSLIATFGTVIGVFYVPTACVLGFKNISKDFKKESIIKIFALSITLVMLIFIVIIGLISR